MTHTQFDGNIEFYNDPKYREANRKFYEAHKLLMECGMTRPAAVEWMRGWGYEEALRDSEP